VASLSITGSISLEKYISLNKKISRALLPKFDDKSATDSALVYFFLIYLQLNYYKKLKQTFSIDIFRKNGNLIAKEIKR